MAEDKPKWVGRKNRKTGFTKYRRVWPEGGKRSKNKGNPKALKKYWLDTIGSDPKKGAFTNCLETLKRHGLPEEFAKKICGKRYNQAAGETPVQHALKKGWPVKGRSGKEKKDESK